MNQKKAISSVSMIVVVVVMIAIVALGAYLVYSSNILGTTTTSQQPSSISLSGFSINPATSNLSGSVVVNSKSSLMRMDVYINGTMMGSLNYTSMKTGMYSLMFSTSPEIMPMMSRMSMQAGKSYTVMMVAHFSDGTKYTASIDVIAGEGMMSQTTGMMQSSTTTNMMSSTGNMMH